MGFLRAMDGLDERAGAWLTQQGAPARALDLWPGPVGVASIEVYPEGIFDFSETGRRAYIQPILLGGAFTDIADLVAWYPDKLGQWWTLLGTGYPLGVDQLDRAELLVQPLLLHAMPLDWLRASGDGVCVLDWTMSATGLRLLPELMCTGIGHGLQVEHELTAVSPSIPLITVPKKEAA